MNKLKGENIMKKKNDIKFIIYQSLYIFVICVIAIKGADINLDEVEIKKMLDPKFAYIDTTQNKIVPMDAYTSLVPFDSNKYLIVPREDYKNNPGKYVTNPPIQIASLQGQIQPPNDNTNTNPKNEQPITEKKKPEIVLGEITLVQYRDNPVNNKGDSPINVKGITISPHSAATVRIDGENGVVVTSGDVSKTFQTIPNKKPQISFARIASMDENAKVTQLQRTVCYRVTINDDYPDQLDVKITGHVTFKQVSPTVYDVTMNAFGSKQAFDNYTDNRQQPYQMGFNVNVTDRIAKHNVTAQNNFVFGEW